MAWLDNVKKFGPYYAQGIFCENYLKLFSEYELLITENEEYKRLENARDKTLTDIKIDVIKGITSQSQYQEIEKIFKDEIIDKIREIECQLYEAMETYKEKMNRALADNPKMCNQFSIPIVDEKKRYTYKTYKSIAERLTHVKAKVDAFMIETKKY